MEGMSVLIVRSITNGNKCLAQDEYILKVYITGSMLNISKTMLKAHFSLVF